jgi:hypothetical protein
MLLAGRFGAHALILPHLFPFHDIC